MVGSNFFNAKRNLVLFEGGSENTDDQGGEGPGNQDEQDPGAGSHLDGQKSPGDDHADGDGKDSRYENLDQVKFPVSSNF